MREIRYRAWDKTSNLMRTDITSIEFKSDGSLAQINVISGTDILFPEKEAVLMQYTGLKDRHGKEIYEGDILKGDWSITDDIEKGVVEFYGGAFRFKPAGLPLEFGYYRKESEVIGNVYENPELLEDKK